MFRTLSSPIMVQWEVISDCNHNCLHYYNHWRTKEPIRGNSNNNYNFTIGDIVIQEIIDNKVFAVNITGGEPLLVIEQILPLINKLSKNNIQVMMNSNLTLLTPETARLLKKCGIKSILVSIPSGNSITCDNITGKKNSLRQIINGISTAKRFDIPMFVNMVVSKINKNEIEETASLVSSLGLKHFATTKASDPSEHKDFTSEILDSDEFLKMQADLEKAGEMFGLKINSLEANPACAYGDIIPKQGYKFCNAGKTVCTIGFDGTIRPCNRANISYGSISENGLKKSWIEMKDWRTDIWMPNMCTNCRIKSVCGGGCKADATKAFGDISMHDPMCTAKPIPKNNFVIERPLLDYTQEFRINPSLKFRSEEFGLIVFLTLNRWTIVDNNLSYLFQKERIFNVKKMADILSVKESDLYPTIDTLFKKNILLQ